MEKVEREQYFWLGCLGASMSNKDKVNLQCLLKFNNKGEFSMVNTFSKSTI